MKKIVLTTISIILLLTTAVGCGCSKKETKETTKKEETKVNTNKDVIKDQNLEVFTFTNTSLIYEDGTSILTTKVTNTSSETQYLKEFKIHVRDKDGNEIIELTGYVGDNIEGNSSTTITSSYAEDLTNANSIDYEIVR